jgi:dihydrofolate synthase/folylpolyglutamate synthase
MTRSSLDQWLQQLASLHPTEIELGLDRVRAVAETLQLLPWSIPAITIAGTNGKGSVAATCEAALVALDIPVGVYTSPHFLSFNERIRVNGREVPDEEIVAAFEQIDAARQGISLTYFEFATLAALVVFRNRGLEWVVLEVGLGGRLDAVNIVDPAVAVITRIDLDHQDWLGDTREKIAAEKAGILRPGAPAVIADPDAPGTLMPPGGAAAYYRVGCEWTAQRAGEGHQLQLRNSAGEFTLTLSGPQALQPENVGAALQALLLGGLPVDSDAVLQAVAGMRVTGRLQRESLAGVDIVLDVAHNPAAVHKLHEYLASNPCNGRTIALFCAMSDKDLHGMIRACVSAVDAWFLADIPDVPRAAKASELAALVHEAGGHMISVSKNIRQAWRRAFTLLGEGDRLVVFGSFFTVAGALPLFHKDSARLGSRETA